MRLTKEKYTPWKYRVSIAKPTYGSRWYYGNFCVGIQVDSHPRFTNLIVSLWFVEIVFSRERSQVKEYKMANGFAVRFEQHSDNPLRSNTN